MSGAEIVGTEFLNVLSVKAIQFRYEASEELSSLFEDFRLMCNDAIRIAVAERPKSRFKLIELAYPRLKEYGLHTHYILSACEVAYSVYCNKNRKSDPYVRRAFLKLDSQTYQLNHLILRIPVKPRHFIYLALQASDYHLSFIDDPTLKRGSITLTDRTLNIAFSKEIAEIEPLGHVGVDINERNVTWSDTSGRVGIEDTSGIAELKERYRVARAKTAKSTYRNAKVKRRLLAKYGRREKNRTVQALHRVSKMIVRHAIENHLGMVMEKLKGIRKLYRKGNGQETSFRGRMNSWTFHEVQRQIDYKARWAGVPVTYVNARSTSRKCPECGSSLIELEGRRLMCPSCRQMGDRDVIASRNIMACAVPQARPSTDEAVRGNGKEDPNPPSRRMEVGLARRPPSLQNPNFFSPSKRSTARPGP